MPMPTGPGSLVLKGMLLVLLNCSPGSVAKFQQNYAVGPSFALIPANRRSSIRSCMYSRIQWADWQPIHLSLRGGDDDEEEGSSTESNATASNEDSLNYEKFGLIPPKSAEELSLNPEYTGKKGELDYLIRDVNIGRWGWTALHRAAVQGDVEALEKMIGMGGDVNAETQSGWTPLHEAANWGRPNVVKFLIKNGANVSATNKNGWTALHFAAGIGHVETIKVLLAAGIDPDYRDSYGDLALHKAMRNSRVRYPVLPIGQDPDLRPDDRRAIYLASAALLVPNGTDLETVELPEGRFDVYAPILPGRRRGYELDDMSADAEVDDVAPLMMDATSPAMAWLSRNESDFANEDEARRKSAESFNSTEMDAMMAFIHSQDSHLPPTVSGDGIQDADVEDHIARWKDEEWEQRINSVIIS